MPLKSFIQSVLLLIFIVFSLNLKSQNVPLIQPVNYHQFSSQEVPLFKWGNPDNATLGQSIYYNFKIVPTNGLSPVEAILTNTPFYETTTSPTTFGNGGQAQLPQMPAKQVEYAWQVKAYNSDDEVFAISNVYVCYGPILLPAFWANNHKFYVDTAYGSYDNLSGKARVRISSSTVLVPIDFNNITVEYTGEWYIRAGTIPYRFPEENITNLTPNNTNNGVCKMFSDSIKFVKNTSTNKYELRKKGYLKWNYPLLIDSVEQGSIKSDPKWYNFDDYRFYGASNFDTVYEFKLLEPLNFSVKYKDISQFSIYSNKYTPSLSGSVLLNDNIVNTKGNRVLIPFTNADDVTYMTNSNLRLSNDIQVNNNSEFLFKPISAVIDLSETVSPPRLLDNVQWKGVYFQKFYLIYANDSFNSEKFPGQERIMYPYDIEKNTDMEAWTNETGIDILK